MTITDPFSPDAQAQYRNLKVIHPDMLLLFHWPESAWGDYYLTYDFDAFKIADLLQVEPKTFAGGVIVTGFPASRLEASLAAIVATGKCAAVLEMVKDAREAKGKTIERVVLPGGLTS